MLVCSSLKNKNWNKLFNTLCIVKHHEMNHYSVQLQQKQFKHEYSHNTKNLNLIFPIFGVTMGVLAIGGVLFKSYYKDALEQKYQENEIKNYASTHCVKPIHYFKPKSIKEVENLVIYCNEQNISFRPMGCGSAPNGIGLSDKGIMDMTNCNKIININKDKLQITMESGIKIKDIISALKPYNMSLQNIPMIAAEQTIGGLIQNGEHNNDINIGPGDMHIVGLTVITPNKGKLILTPNDDLFYYARTGLGLIGVITEVTLQCVERQKLSQFIWIMNVDELIKKRNELIQTYKHLKYLWIPYINDKVIVIANKPINDPHFEALYQASKIDINSIENKIKCQEALRNLYYDKYDDDDDELDENICFHDLRNKLLNYNDSKYILDKNWIQQINLSELEYWENLMDLTLTKNIKNEEFPINIDFEENILNDKDNNGEEWIYEVCFKINKLDNNDIPIEIQFSLDILEKINGRNICAHSPLKQTFTASSSSYLSPSYSENINDLFCWFCIKFSIPKNNQQKQRWIQNEFKTYSCILNDIADKYNGIGHWAHIQTYCLDSNEREKLQNRLKKHYGDRLNKFLKLTNEYDPKGILRNDTINELFDY